MSKVYFLFSIVSIFLSISSSFTFLAAQTLEEEQEPEFQSIREQQLEEYNQWEDFEHINEEELGTPSSNFTAKGRDANCRLTKEIYGYHPHWMDKYYRSYDYSLLSTFCYFGYHLNPKTGHYNNIYGWKTHPSIDLAKKAGAKVELCVMNFGHKNNAAFLGNKKAWARLADNLIKLLDYRDADGINIDFEGIGRRQGKELSEFLIYLSKRLKSERTSQKVTTLTLAIPAVDWYKIFDLKKLEKYVDRFIIMGYDYHFKREKKAGPVAPLNHNYQDAWYKISLKQTVRDYLRTGVKASQLVMALPYYGYEWKTENIKIPSKRRTNTSGKARTYTKIRSDYAKFTKRYHKNSASPYYITGSDARPKQCWYDDEFSLGKKYDYVIEEKLGGIGIWALGYDNGYSDLWDLLKDKFVDCDNVKTQLKSTFFKPEAPVNELCKPITTIGALKNTYRYDFDINFEDKDDCESGWSGNYFQVLEHDGIEWRGNPQKGFFNDEFIGVGLHRDWTVQTGAWLVTEFQLHQLDAENTNSNIYLPLKQEETNSYLYHWWAKMEGGSSSRRSGIHFFADDPTSENRGNSYFVYFRVDNDRAEIYKVTNNQYERKAYGNIILEPFQEYDYKLTFNPKTGLVEIFVDNKLVLAWQDDTPIVKGDYVSFRTGDCQLAVDFFKVYKSRGESATIKIGTSHEADIRHKIRDIDQPNGRIISIAKNNYQQWTAPDTKEIFVE